MSARYVGYNTLFILSSDNEPAKLVYKIIKFDKAIIF